MRNFFKTLLIYFFTILLLLSSIALFDIFVVGNQYSKGYNASIIDKVDNLTSINKPKIILVGNSNLSFGIDSRKIEEKTGMSVVNLGLHGGLGNAFHEDIAKFNIGKDDIVVICHTSYDDENQADDYELMWTTLEYNTNLYSLIRKEYFAGLLKTYPKYLLKSIKLWLTSSGNKTSYSCYSRDSFNKYGDVVIRPLEEKRHKDEIFNSYGVITVPKISEVCIDRINQLNGYIESKGATLLVAAYPIASGEYTPSVSEYEDFEKELRERLDCDVISNYVDYFIPYEYFYNTALHLNNEGVEIRTDLLIEDLNKWRSINNLN